MQKEDEDLTAILRRHGMTTVPLSIEVKAEGYATKSFSVRVVLPESDNWLERLIQNGWNRRADRDTHLLALELFGLSALLDRRSPRNTRAMSIAAWDKSPEVKELRKTLRETRPADQMLQTIFGEVTSSVPELLAKARCRNSLPELPADEAGYLEFREIILREYERLETGTDADSSKDDLGDKDGRSDQHVDDTALQRLFTHALAFDKKASRHYEQLADEAESVLEAAAARASRNETVPLLDQFVWPEVNRLLRHAANAVGDPSGGNQAELAAELATAAKGRSLAHKVDGVFYIWRHVRDRAPYAAHLLAEIDDAGSYLLGRAAEQLYRGIYRYLSRAERRLFVLMYIERRRGLGQRGPSYPLGGFTPWFDPILLEAARDEQLSKLIVLVIGFKQKKLWRHDLAAELEARFKAYLAFYPYWLALTQDREKEERQRRRAHARQRRSPGGDPANLRDPKSPEAVPRKGKVDWVSELKRAFGPGGFAGVLQRYGIDDSQGVAQMIWFEGRTQREIAARLGVTQQAVSYRFRRVMNSLLAALSADGHLPHGVRLRGGRWAPRG